MAGRPIKLCGFEYVLTGDTSDIILSLISFTYYIREHLKIRGNDWFKLLQP
jgi:hypothetical protein